MLHDPLRLERQPARIARIERDEIEHRHARQPGQVALTIADLAVGEVEQRRQVVRRRPSQPEHPHRPCDGDAALDPPAEVEEPPRRRPPHMLRRQAGEGGIAALERPRAVEGAAGGREGRLQQPHHVRRQPVARPVADRARQAVDGADRLAVLAFHGDARKGGEVGAAERRGMRRGTAAGDQPDQPAHRSGLQGRAAIGVDRMTQQRADRRQQRLAPLQIATQPEEIVGDAAWQGAGIAADVERIDVRQQRHRRDRVGAVDADIGRPGALAHHRRARVRRLADAREAARHDRPAAVGAPCGEDAQGEGAGDQRVSDHHRHGRQPHHLLPDIILRPADQVGNQRGARLAGQVASRHRSAIGQAKRRVGKGGADQQAVETLLDMRALARAPAPPGGDVGQLQRLAQQVHRQLWQEGGKGGLFEQPRARRVGDHDVALRIGVDQARHADLRMGVERQRIEQARVDPPPDGIDALQPADGADVQLVL